MHEQAIGTARNLSDGGDNAVRVDLQDGQNESDPAGLHNVRTFILYDLNLVGGDVKVLGVYGGEQGDVRLELCPVYPPERRVDHEVERGELDQHWYPIGLDPPLHRLYTSCPILVLSSHNAEEGV